MLLLSFLLGMFYMWFTVAIVCDIIDVSKGTNYLGTWCEAWNFLPELKHLLKK